MPHPAITVRPTIADDIPAAEQVLADGKCALAALGIPQWQGAYPNREDIARDIAASASYVATDSTGAVLGICALGFDGEPTYDVIEGTWLTASASNAPCYAVIHRCATSAAAARQGVMSALFEACERYAREQGMLSMRVDTHERNAPMRAFLVAHGYTLCGTITLAATGELDPRRLAYEKLLT